MQILLYTCLAIHAIMFVTHIITKEYKVSMWVFISFTWLLNSIFK